MSKKGIIISVIISLTIGVFVSAFIIRGIYKAKDYLNYVAGNSTDEIFNKYLDVEIGDFEVTDGIIGVKTKLIVKVKNKSSEKRSFMIDIEAVDKEGTRISTESIYVDDLGAGQSQNFEIFKYVSDDKVEDMKNAEFRVFEASTI